VIAYILLFTGGVWITYGLTMILFGFLAMLWVLIDWGGGVHMGPDPELPAVTQEIRRVGAETHVWHTSPQANWHPYIDAITTEMHAVEAAVIDISDTVEIKPVADPLAATAELEVVDVGTPLYYTIKRPPPPPRLETHTQAWERDGLLARIREAAEEMAP